MSVTNSVVILFKRLTPEWETIAVLEDGLSKRMKLVPGLLDYKLLDFGVQLLGV